MKRSFVYAALIVTWLQFVFLPYGFAAHPLITDDTGTQGKKNFQVEINSEFNYDREKEDGGTKQGDVLAEIALPKSVSIH